MEFHFHFHFSLFVNSKHWKTDLIFVFTTCYLKNGYFEFHFSFFISLHMASPSVSSWRRVISHLPLTFAIIINVPTSPSFLYLMSPHPRPTCSQVPRLKSQVPPHASQCPCSSFKHSRFPSLLVLTGGDAICREMKNEKWNSNSFFNVMQIPKRKFKSVFQSYVKTKNEKRKTKVKSAFQSEAKNEIRKP